MNADSHSVGGCSIVGQIASGNISGQITSGNISGQITIGNFGGESYPEYQGSYTIEPEFASQSLATQNKLLRQNVTVNAIKVERVSNVYGTTVYIGGIIDG